MKSTQNSERCLTKTEQNIKAQENVLRNKEKKEAPNCYVISNFLYSSEFWTIFSQKRLEVTDVVLPMNVKNISF